jgi:hypothetical protein
MKIRHIGIIYNLCSNKTVANEHSLREDLGYDRYENMGVVERFKDEKPYRICKKCLAIIKKKEGI